MDLVLRGRGRHGAPRLERVMNLDENRMRMRILRLTRSPAIPAFRIPKPFLIEFITRSKEKAKRTLVMAVELVDRQEYRDAIAASLDEQVDREANALIREMGEILRRQSKITRRRQEDLFGRVRALKGAVADYEALLEREISDARANLELAQKKEAQSLLSRVEVS